MSRPVVHFELPADDVDRAREFYRAAFGWNVMPLPEMGYTILGTATSTDETGRPTEPGEINGGMFARSDDVSQPVITIAVDDIDAALTKIEQCGGKTVRGRLAVGDMGFTGYFSDSEGTVVGLWQKAS
jgi:predicted enzyme related to lactoylglutathione lyase